MLNTVVLLTAAFAATNAVPADLVKRQEIDLIHCDIGAVNATGPYLVGNNLWGYNESKDPTTEFGKGGEFAGTGCTYVDSFDETTNTLGWHTSWTWNLSEGRDNMVKSYPNVNVTTDLTDIKRLSDYTSIWTSWSWEYTWTGENITADVAYDLWVGEEESSAMANWRYEVMIWLASYGGPRPISNDGNGNDVTDPIQTVNIAGRDWKLYRGSTASEVGWTVYSFLPVLPDPIATFEANLLDFTHHLSDTTKCTNPDGTACLPEDQYLVTVQAGTEPFAGYDAVFTTSAFETTIE